VVSGATADITSGDTSGSLETAAIFESCLFFDFGPFEMFWKQMDGSIFVMDFNIAV